MMKTIVLAQRFDDSINYRTSIEALFAELNPSQSLLFDWAGIRFISRSAADQWNREMERCLEPVECINQDEDVAEMIAIAKRTRFASAPTPQQYTLYQINSPEEFLQLVSF